MMNPACNLGLHRWRSKPTHRPGVSVHRCYRCNQRFLTKNGRDRRKKRRWLGGAVVVSVATWYLVIALGLTGHTKIFWGAQKLVSGAQKGADHMKRDMGGAFRSPTPSR